MRYQAAPRSDPHDGKLGAARQRGADYRRGLAAPQCVPRRYFTFGSLNFSAVLFFVFGRFRLDRFDRQKRFIKRVLCFLEP